MDRIYEYEDAKRLCASHNQLLDTIQNVYADHARVHDEVNSNVKSVLESNVIASGIWTSLSSGDINIQASPVEMALIKSVHAYDVGENIIAALGKEKVGTEEIKKDILILKSMNSGLKWFFSSDVGKVKANKAYRQLSDLMDGDYAVRIKELTEKYRLLKNVSSNVAYQTLFSNEEKYKWHVIVCYPLAFDQEKMPPAVSRQIDLAGSVLNQYFAAQSEREKREEDAKRNVEVSLQPLIHEQAMQELRKHDLEVLSQKRSGIRIKALRDQGYKTVADVYAASEYQLASVYGISQEAAGLIKSASQEVLKDIAGTIKLKISSDDRSAAATKLLHAVYQYDLIHRAGDRLNPEDKKNLNDLNTTSKFLSELKNNLIWIFSTADRKKKYIDAYQSVSGYLAPHLKDVVNLYCQDIQVDTSASDTWVWADFSTRSVEYFNDLEELCPGAFGNGDTLYGLPEDLAREIQDQVYFPQGLKVTLRRYQEWGVKYILHQEKALLGDEMGLGKTVQAIATMVSLRNIGAKKFLVVCPASVLPNWCKEIDKKSQFHSIKIHGWNRQEAFDSWLLKGGVAVTTYETLNTLNVPEMYQYDLLVVDEAHFIKNTGAIRSKNVRAFGKHAQRILFMTGTALENKVEEMISLLQVLNPAIAKKAQSIAFMSTAPQFRQMIAPVYYRRKREDVLTELPAITYSDEWCDLLPEEEQIYEKAVMQKDSHAIRKVSWQIQDLKKSAKANRMMEIIEEAAEDGRKILVFSNYLETIKRVIALLGKRCTQPINGSVSVERRQEIIDEFEKMPAGSVLPAQIIAGGTGLNIQSASVVIICEPQLKPSIENQAVSRAYRMGQTRKVLVYRLLASNTIDERIDDMLSEKQAIFDAFADISVAASATQKEEQQIDDKTFGKLIQEEIDRINAKNGGPIVRQDNAQTVVTPVPEQQKTKLQKPEQQKIKLPDPVQQKIEFPAPELQKTKSVQAERIKESVSQVVIEKPKKRIVKPEPEGTKKISITDKTVFSGLNDFINTITDMGIVIKDNRDKAGCLWVKADPRIDAIIEKQKFGNRGFKYSAKSKALGGEPGWYY